MAKAYMALRIDRKQLRVLKAVARADHPLNPAEINRRVGRMSEGLVYKIVHLLEGPDTRGFALIERLSQADSQWQKFFQLSDMGAVALLGLGTITERVKTIPPWGEILQISETIENKDVKNSFLIYTQKLARRATVYSPNKGKLTMEEAWLRSQEVLKILRLMRPREDITQKELEELSRKPRIFSHDA